MTQKAVKQQMIEARLLEVRAEVQGYPKTAKTATDIWDAVTTLYVVGLIDIRFLKAISDFYYGGKLDEEVQHRAPELFQRLSARGKIGKVTA